MRPIRFELGGIITVAGWLFSLIAIIMSFIALTKDCKCPEYELSYDKQIVTTTVLPTGVEKTYVGSIEAIESPYRENATASVAFMTDVTLVKKTKK